MKDEKPKQRLTYIDVMRGVACILMFQTHAYDSWLSPAARTSRFFQYSQLASTLAATSFLFLVGVSQALAIEGMVRRGASGGKIAASTIRRGAKILLLAFVFRVQEFVLSGGHAPWTDLLRVDVLNVIGVSIMLIGLVAWVGSRAGRGVAAATAALGIAMLTPPLWTTWRPDWLPWFLESYVNGVHTFPEPQPWLFPVFPWAAFCFAGLAAGVFVRSEWAGGRPGLSIALVAAGGAALPALALSLDALPVRLYSSYDFWHTSPNFFLFRLGLLLLLLSGCYWWSRFRAGEWVKAGLILLGQNSLLVYWVHIEFVYGRFSILPKRGTSVLTASAGLLVIIAAMLILSARRVWLRWQATDLLMWLRQKAWLAREY